MDEKLNMSLNEYALGSALALAIKTISAAATALAINAKIKRQFGLLCGADSLPHLIAALGPVQRALRPGLLFLYIAGWISWVIRSYLVAIRGEKKPELINGDFVIDDTDIS